LNQGLFIALLNPAVSLALAVAFFVLWCVQRWLRHALLLCAGYLCCMGAFALQGFEFGMGFAASRLLSNFLFFAAMFLIASAAVSRTGQRPPYGALAICTAVGMAAFIWFLVGQPDFEKRVFAVNFGLGAMCVVLAVTLYRAPKRMMIDRAIVWVAALGALDFFIRPVLSALFAGGYPLMAGMTTPYWLVTNLSALILTLVIALMLFSAVALDAIYQLRTESHTDALSGLLNRRGFHDKTAAFFANPRGPKVPVGLVLADLDHFKAVNDRHGHAVGDAVITAFAGLLRQAGADKAIIGRTGGEEFAVFMPQCDLGAARLFAEGVRAALSSGALEQVTPRLGPVTCSFGVAARIGDESLEALFKRADDALMQAKRAGRDRVRVTHLRPDAAEWRTGA
jgi:diguanylate cyclase (GGDEF)-like protein